jgi:predicted small lipoprotein YifL
MNGGSRLAMGSLVGALLVMSMSACGHKGTLSIENAGPGEVTVFTGDQQLTVPSSGAIDVLDYGCTLGDVTVKLASGQQVLLHGPVCPDQRILVSEGTATLAPA